MKRTGFLAMLGMVPVLPSVIAKVVERAGRPAVTAPVMEGPVIVMGTASIAYSHFANPNNHTYNVYQQNTRALHEIFAEDLDEHE